MFLTGLPVKRTGTKCRVAYLMPKMCALYSKQLYILTLSTLLMQCSFLEASALCQAEKVCLSDSTWLGKHLSFHKKKTKPDSLVKSQNLAQYVPTSPLDRFHLPTVDTTQKLSLSSLKIHGTAGISAFSSSYAYPGQLMPTSYVRWQFNPDIDLFNIPFGTNLFLSTEQKQFKDINSLGFHLDRNVLEQRIRNQIKEQTDLKRLADIQKNKYNELLEKQYDSLQSKLNEPSYLANISRYKSIAEKEITLDSFNLSQNRSQIDKAKEKVAEFEAAQKRLKELEESAIPYKEYKIKQRLIDEVNRNKPLNEGKLAESMGLPDKYQPWLRVIYGIKDFEFGQCHPDYSELTVRGTSLKGVDLAFNPGNLIIGGTTGKLIQPNYYSLIPEYLQTSTRRLSGGRVGFGKLDNSHVTLTYLSAKDDAGQAEITPLPKENKVLALQGVYEVNQDFIIESEVSQSVTSPISNENSQSNSVFSNQNQSNRAYSLKATGRVPGVKTRLTGSWRYIGPGYESYGTPFLRKDINRTELKADQDFFGRKLSATAFVRQDHDNLNNTKEFRSTTLNYGFRATLRLRKLPVLTASYSPLAQLSDRPTHTDSLLFGSEFWTVGANYSIRKRRTISSTFLNYSSSQSKGEGFHYANQVIMLSQVIAIEKKFSLSATLCYADASGLLGRGKRILSELSIEKTFKQKYTIKSGGYYRDQLLSTNISGGYLQGGFPITKFSELQLRGDAFKASNMADLQYSTLCNLLIHW